MQHFLASVEADSASGLRCRSPQARCRTQRQRLHLLGTVRGHGGRLRGPASVSQVLADYLSEVERGLRGLSSGRRRLIVRELEAHLRDEAEARELRTEAQFAALLEEKEVPGALASELSSGEGTDATHRSETALVGGGMLGLATGGYLFLQGRQNQPYLPLHKRGGLPHSCSHSFRSDLLRVVVSTNLEFRSASGFYLLRACRHHRCSGKHPANPAARLAARLALRWLPTSMATLLEVVYCCDGGGKRTSVDAKISATHAGRVRHSVQHGRLCFGLVGRTALSEEIMTKSSTPCSAAATATLYVPKTLFSMASKMCASIRGTCLYAAA